MALVCAAVVRRKSTASSSAWRRRQSNDPFVKRRLDDDFRSRAAYKLAAIDDKVKLLRPGVRVLELGAAPGSWSQLAVRRGASVTGLDLQPVAPLPGCTFIQGDFRVPSVQALLPPADLILSDMAPAASGCSQLDGEAAANLTRAVLDFVPHRLTVGGSLICKLFDYENTELLQRAQLMFSSARLVKPPASRVKSSEIFLLAQNFRPS